MTTQETPKPSIIGTAVPRVDGRLKTSGAAMYSADYIFPGMVYLVPVCSPISKGKITRLDASKAEKMPGVLCVMYHGHGPSLYRPIPGDQDAIVDESRPPFEGEVIYYGGQYVAAVVAETMEQARAAADAISVEYASEIPNVALDLSDGWESLQVESHR